MSARRIGMLWVVVLALGAFLTGCSGDPNPVDPSQQVTIVETTSPYATAIQRHIARHHRTATMLTPLRDSSIASTSSILSQPGDDEPVPIPGGLVPGFANVWVPGPVELGLGGTNQEPSTITDFHGFSAIAYLAGVTTGSDGKLYEMFHDMRVFSGNYLSADGTHHRGTFVFI